MSGLARRSLKDPPTRPTQLTSMVTKVEPPPVDHVVASATGTLVIQGVPERGEPPIAVQLALGREVHPGPPVSGAFRSTRRVAQ